MRFRLPQGCARVTHAGETIGVAADGSIELDAEAASLLAPHGIVPLEEPPSIDPTRITGMEHADLVAALAARDVEIPSKANDAALRGLLRQVLAKPR